MKIGDLVTRKKYNNDIVFRITNIENDLVYLTGEYLRIKADAFFEDLKKYDGEEEKIDMDLVDVRDSKLIPGCVLHLDGDEKYLNKSMELYKKYNIPAKGYYMDEKKMEKQIINLLIEHKPDVLVITGHDSVKIIEGREKFENSEYFVKAVKKARIYESGKDSLVIFAGACQSYYEGLIEAGANFASSPSRKNINVLDPVYIAISVCKSHVNEFIDVENVLKKTISKGVGLGGVDTRGVARKLYQ